MKLSDLLRPWCDHLSMDCDVRDLQNDSRKVTQGTLFIAYPGAAADGRRFISQAVAQGAVAVVYEPEHWPDDMPLPQGIPCIAVVNLSKQLAALAYHFYDNPSQGLAITGVTGTNGKTTIAYQLTQAHQLLGYPAAYIGTLGHGLIGQFSPLLNTTPDALQVQHLLHDYQQSNIHHICMEVSSHALSEHRVDHVPFQEAIYTNLSHEHLDYHRTMADYATAKSALFAQPSLKWVIINQDDAYAEQMKSVVPKGVRILTYGIEQTADVQARDCKLDIHGSEFTVTSPWGEQRLQISSLGAFNVYNSLAVYTSLLAHDYPVNTIVDVMAKLVASPGRMEIVAQQPCVIVDYAHTPAALDNVLKTLHCLKSSNNTHIWVVFGCGGDRDRTKRPLMGQIVSQYAHNIILTSDNPRHEDPEAIIQDIIAGIDKNTAVTTIVDRREALHYALHNAVKEDIILIAGKGHEDYQIIGDTRSVFSDQAEVKGILACQERSNVLYNTNK